MSLAGSLFGVIPPPPASSARRGAISLFPEEDDVPLSGRDDVLAQQSSRRAETASKGCRSLAFVRGELACPSGFELVNIVHILAHYCAPFSG